ncbi:hypothetical protein [Micromonospora auratinigra]|uniref:Uncharacterized protein n=1 Tax=Micromonospora auratinigra TaxID=261654 RepID=A0A1A9A957_9ACTN|nr:hypothetical protein [Micromonospora auratinigra]SBT52729.1 hypothetical protein GA0070611_5761 [Micromonospora auratinigra]
MTRYRYPPEALAAAAARARTVTEVLRLLGVRPSGGSHAHISRQLNRFGIDTSHFSGQAHNKGQRGGRFAPSHGTVSNILRRAGLHTVSARRSRLGESAGVA